MQRVAANNDLLFRQIDPDVAIGMSIAQPKNLHGSRLAVENKTSVEGQRWQSDLHALQFGQVGFSLLKIALPFLFLFRIGGAREIRFQLLNILRNRGNFVFDPWDTAALDVLARGLRGNDFNPSRP